MTNNVDSPKTLILGFPETESQAKSVAELAGLPYTSLFLRRFPDGESYVRIPDELPEHVILFCSLFQANEKLIELLLAASTARKAGVTRLSLMAPYLCYMRQDEAFNKGEAVSQSIIGALLAQHFDDLLTIDPHLHRTPVLSDAMPVANAQTLTASELISTYLHETLDTAPLILGPDAESEQWAKQIAAPNQLEYCIATKTRFGDREVNVDVPEVSIEGRTVVIIDDISSTGNTIIQAAKQIYGKGAQHIYAIVTHALLDDAAMQSLKDAGVETVWSTDTIPHQTNVISVVPVLASAIKKHLL
jgi:ribose-phosphate pyrophosphokinase